MWFTKVSLYFCKFTNYWNLKTLPQQEAEYVLALLKTDALVIQP